MFVREPFGMVSIRKRESRWYFEDSDWTELAQDAIH
jgi:hypothetical protein